jgi:hypothetical protein
VSQIQGHFAAYPQQSALAILEINTVGDIFHQGVQQHGVIQVPQFIVHSINPFPQILCIEGFYQ